MLMIIHNRLNGVGLSKTPFEPRRRLKPGCVVDCRDLLALCRRRRSRLDGEFEVLVKLILRRTVNFGTHLLLEL